jgi:hypothetical protein
MNPEAKLAAILVAHNFTVARRDKNVSARTALHPVTIHQESARQLDEGIIVSNIHMAYKSSPEINKKRDQKYEAIRCKSDCECCSEWSIHSPSSPLGST